MHILYICHYFYPEPGAPSARGLEMAARWVQGGHRVSVLTCFPNHPTGVIPPAYRGRRYLQETVQGISVHRVWTYASPQQGFIRRSIGHLVFTAAAMWQSRGRLDRPDVVVTSSPPLFSGLAGWWLSRRHRTPFVFEVRDLWPAAIVELGALRPGPAVRLLEALEMWLYRKAARVVVVTRSFRERLAERGVPTAKVEVITNGVAADRFTPQPADNAFRREWGLDGKFVVEYAGAHGVSHALPALLEAAVALKSDPDAHFLFVGEGAEKAALRARARELGLANVTFAPAQPAERMPEVYAAADVCLVPLRKVPLFRTFLPSKMFEIMGAGRPMVASVEGEAAAILEQAGAALVVPPEDAGAIAAALLRLKREPGLAATLSRRGRDYVLQHYNRSALADQYLNLLAAVAKEGSR